MAFYVVRSFDTKRILLFENQSSQNVVCSLKAFYRSSPAAATGKPACEWLMYKEKHLRFNAKGLRVRNVLGFSMLCAMILRICFSCLSQSANSEQHRRTSFWGGFPFTFEYVGEIILVAFPCCTL